MSRVCWLATFAPVIAVAAHAGADDTEVALPEAYPASRYVDLWTRPLFFAGPESEPAAVDPEPSFARHFVLVGITDVEGEMVVTIRDRQHGRSFDLRHGEMKDSVRLLQVDIDPDPAGTKVHLTRGDDRATLGYDLTRLRDLRGASPQPPAIRAAGPDSEAALRRVVPPAVSKPITEASASHAD